MRRHLRDEDVGPILDAMGHGSPPMETLEKLLDIFEEDVYTTPEKRAPLMLLLQMAYFAGLTDGATAPDVKNQHH